jgi:hypothetical protein
LISRLNTFPCFITNCRFFQGLDAAQGIAIDANDIRPGILAAVAEWAECGSAYAGLAFC